MKTRLLDITEVIRSKNAGPSEITFDIMFKDMESFEKTCKAKAIKGTIKRPVCSDDLGETDVYGAQQHALLLGLEFDL